MKSEKVTERTGVEVKRRYVDACGLAHALELLGERWAMLVIRELLLGARRFSELKADLPGISANVLTQRLTELEVRGLVRRRKLPPPASVHVYEATPWALDAGPILCELGRWAFRSPAHDGRQPVGPVAILLSMRTNFDAPRAAGVRTTIAFNFGSASYFAEVKDGTIDVVAGDPDTADAIVTCRPDDLKFVLYGGVPVESLQIVGDVEAVRLFVGLFSLPPKVATPLSG